MDVVCFGASFKVPLSQWARGVVCGCTPVRWYMVELGAVSGVDTGILVDHGDIVVIVVDNGFDIVNTAIDRFTWLLILQ